MKWCCGRYLLYIDRTHRHLPLDNLSCRTSLRNHQMQCNYIFPYLYQTYTWAFISQTFSWSIQTHKHTHTHPSTHESTEESNNEKDIINWMRFKLCKNIILGCFLYPIEPINKRRSRSKCETETFYIEAETLNDHFAIAFDLSLTTTTTTTTTDALN